MQLEFTFGLGHFSSKYNISGDFHSMLTLKKCAFLFQMEVEALAEIVGFDI